MNKIITVSENAQAQFEYMVNGYLQDGYKILSTSCGFLNSESYDFVDIWQAILYKED